jgi:hypothetical protein
MKVFSEKIGRKNSDVYYRMMNGVASLTVFFADFASMIVIACEYVLSECTIE